MKLEPLFQELNSLHFQGELPLPVLRWNSRLSSSAGRFAPGSRNPIFPRPPKIEIAAYLKDIPEGDFHIRDTMLHEMVHYVLWHRKKPYGHTPEFHAILKKVGARRFNTVPKHREPKYWYQCPACRIEFPRKRPLKKSACLDCCRKFNGGYYSDRFRLVEIPKPILKTDPKVILRPAPSPTPESPKKEPVFSVAEVIQRLEELKGMLSRK